MAVCAGPHNDRSVHWPICQTFGVWAYGGQVHISFIFCYTQISDENVKTFASVYGKRLVVLLLSKFVQVVPFCKRIYSWQESGCAF